MHAHTRAHTHMHACTCAHTHTRMNACNNSWSCVSMWCGVGESVQQTVRVGHQWSMRYITYPPSCLGIHADRLTSSLAVHPVCMYRCSCFALPCLYDWSLHVHVYLCRIVVLLTCVSTCVWYQSKHFREWKTTTWNNETLEIHCKYLGSRCHYTNINT